MSKPAPKWDVIALLCLSILVFCFAGCGVDWFPSTASQPTTPNKFTFSNRTGAALGVTVTSNPITVSGLTASTSPISINGPVGSNSQYAINGGSPTSSSGSVKNGDTVTVQHTSANAVNSSVTSTLSIGTVTATFTSLTRIVDVSALSTPVNNAGLAQAYVVVSSFDGLAGTHVVSISDPANKAKYAIGDANGNPILFTNQTQTITVLNGVRIWMQNVPSTSTSPVITTLTIDGYAFRFSLTLP
ncbi:MAG TPA: hypothetical protein VJ550_09330 [Geomonas sp.]|nr:hypothetical protein [Geomonas sp.]